MWNLYKFRGCFKKQVKNRIATEKLSILKIALIVLFLFFVFWYKQGNRIETTESRAPEFSDLGGTLLKAKQDSPFKDLVIAKVLDHYKSIPVPVQVIDVVDLKTMDFSNFDAILLVYRWEARNPPEVVASFIH